MPIIARAKPSPSASVPTVITDKYTELVTAINEQVGALTQGRVVAAKALKADNATNAEHATRADNATTAANATNAANAANADNAINAANAEKALELNFGLVGTALISSGYTDNDSAHLPSGALQANCVYLARFYQTREGPTNRELTDAGIFIYNPSAESVRVCIGGNRIAEILNGKVVSIKNNDNDILTVTGTLYIYKIGTLTT